MQNCFREYPEIYGAELDQEEEDEDVAVDLAQPEAGNSTDSATSSKTKDPAHQEHADSAPRDESNAKKDHSMVPESYRPNNSDSKTEEAQKATEQVMREHKPESESDTLVPKASHDATADNKGKKSNAATSDNKGKN
jgi:intermembrane space import and assembly protein 40